jgi:hypothetical protein
VNSNKVGEYIRKGAKDRTWYADTQALFTELFGPPPMLTLVTKLFAATSINSSLKSNIRLFRRALYEIENNLPQGKYLPVMAQQIDAIRNGRPMSGRKINSFAAAMSGDVNAVVVDVWLLRAFDTNNRYYRQQSETVREGGATKWQYDVIEEYVRQEARLRGLEPREISSMIWSGIRGGVTRYDQILRNQMFNMYDLS